MDDAGQLIWQGTAYATSEGRTWGLYLVGSLHDGPVGYVTQGISQCCYSAAVGITPGRPVHGVAVPPGSTLEEAQARVVDGYNRLLAMESQRALEPKGRDILGNEMQPNPWANYPWDQ